MTLEEPSIAPDCPSGNQRFILAAGEFPVGHTPKPVPPADDDDEDDDDDLRKPGSGEGNIDPDDDEGVGDDEDDEDDDDEDTLWTCRAHARERHDDALTREPNLRAPSTGQAQR
jgi:hypothetical protein